MSGDFPSPAEPFPAARVKFVGARVSRKEDAPLIAGKGHYAGDINFPHQLYMRVVRSDRAHGKIIAIDAAEALALPGVAAVWTSNDVAGIPPIDFRATSYKGLEPYRQPVLARDVVRYVGEPVALVFAEDEYLAEDAAELVAVEIEDLPPILAPDGPTGAFDATHGTEVTVVRQGFGDVDAGFAAAHTVVELDLRIGRHSAVPLETRGAVARHDAARDVLELHGATKRPHFHRDQLAKMLGRSPAQVHFYEGHIGGGFGVRGELYPEDILVCAAALELGRPVKWIEDRREHLMATNQSRDQRHLARIAVDGDGRILAIDDTYYHDQGAYIRTHGVRVPDMTAGTMLGPYRVPAFRANGHVRLTNKTPAATYRGPGRYESSFVRERLIDAVADRLAIDPLELRRRNMIPSDEMPFATGLQALEHEVVIDSGDYELLLDKALDRFGWDALTEQVAARRAAGEAVGLGLAYFVEKSAPGPTDGVRIKVDVTGAVEVLTGGASVGQGFETVMAQICADAMGVDYERIRVAHGRTDLTDFGFGAHASRATVMTGEATRIAADNLRKLAIEVASELLQAPPGELEVVDGKVVREAGGEIGLDEIARALTPGAATLGGRTPGLTAEGWFRTDHMCFPYGLHGALVRVDRDTGGVIVERYFVAYDIGRAVNPMLVEGQIHGGAAQGIGGALLEEFVYSETGEPLSVTLADYMMPTIKEMPPVEVLITEDAPSPLYPLGFKGAGEAGINAAGAAIACAVDDAIGVKGAITQLPITPQRVRKILKGQD